jgi:hypothetical protein
VVAETRMGDAALIPLRIFRIRAAAVAIAASVIVGMAMFGGIMLLPLYMQIVHDASPTEAGFLMLPMVVGMMAASIGSGQVISRTGRTRIFPIVGSLLITAGLLLLSLAGADTPLVRVLLAMFVLGLGLGNCMQPLLLILQSAVPPRDIGVASSSATFFRQIGGTLGVAVFLSILFASVGGNIASAVRAESQTPAWSATVHDPQVMSDPLNHAVVQSLQHPSPSGGVLAQVQDDSSIISRMNAVLAHPFKAGFADSMSTVFVIAGCVAFLAFLILLLMPQVELRATSASAAARTEGLAAAAPREDELG